MNVPKQVSIVAYTPEYESCLPSIQQLYYHSFPESERRLWDEILDLLSHEPRFTMHLLFVDKQCVGFLNTWTFPNFVYGEHLAVEPAQRGGGIGRSLLDTLWNKADDALPWVFEVEPPTTEIAERRISFYESLGGQIIDTEYIQPSYQKSGTPIPLYLMTRGGDASRAKEYARLLKEVVYATGKYR